MEGWEGREFGSGGREGPKSLSESESESDGAEVGRVDRSAGGGAGPICWRRMGRGVICWRFGDFGGAGGSASALRFVEREGGRVGPMVGMMGSWYWS